MQIHNAEILILLPKSFVEIKVANFTLYNTLKLRFARFAEDVKLPVIYAGLLILIIILKS